MRHVLATMFLALITCLAACGGSESRGPDPLFDIARSDVHNFKSDDGRDLGLVNTTHGVLWDYEHGYSRFDANREIVWGPLASIPDGERASMQSADAQQSTADGVGATSPSWFRIGGGGGIGTTVCTCCYVRINGTCGCLDCRTY